MLYCAAIYTTESCEGMPVWCQNMQSWNKNTQNTFHDSQHELQSNVLQCGLVSFVDELDLSSLGKLDPYTVDISVF